MVPSPHLIRGLPEYHKPLTLCGGTRSSSKSERGYPVCVFHSTHPLPRVAVPFPFLTLKPVDTAATDNCRQEIKWDMYIDVTSPHPNCYISACILKTIILIAILFLKSEINLNQTRENSPTKNYNAHINWNSWGTCTKTIKNSNEYFISIGKHVYVVSCKYAQLLLCF